MEMESEDENREVMTVPSHFKKYTMEDRKIVIKQPIRTWQKPNESYDGPENAKKIDLADEGQEPRLAYIATNLELVEEELLIKTLKEYTDVFTWSYRDLKGVGTRLYVSTQFPWKMMLNQADNVLIHTMIHLPRKSRKR